MTTDVAAMPRASAVSSKGSGLLVRRMSSIQVNDSIKRTAWAMAILRGSWCGRMARNRTRMIPALVIREMSRNTEKYPMAAPKRTPNVPAFPVKSMRSAHQ